jgi:hypothetical protein
MLVYPSSTTSFYRVTSETVHFNVRIAPVPRSAGEITCAATRILVILSELVVRVANDNDVEGSIYEPGKMNSARHSLDIVWALRRELPETLVSGLKVQRSFDCAATSLRELAASLRMTRSLRLLIVLCSYMCCVAPVPCSAFLGRMPFPAPLFKATLRS